MTLSSKLSLPAAVQHHADVHHVEEESASHVIVVVVAVVVAAAVAVEALVINFALIFYRHHLSHFLSLACQHKSKVYFSLSLSLSLSYTHTRARTHSDTLSHTHTQSLSITHKHTHETTLTRICVSTLKDIHSDILCFSFSFYER